MHALKGKAVVVVSCNRELVVGVNQYKTRANYSPRASFRSKDSIYLYEGKDGQMIVNNEER